MSDYFIPPSQRYRCANRSCPRYGRELLAPGPKRAVPCPSCARVMLVLGPRPSPRERFNRLLEALDLRLEDQLLKIGADAPFAVRTVGRFNDVAGAAERLPDTTSPSTLAAVLRALRTLVNVHRTAVRVAATGRALP